jgi:hypothetical protein
MKLITLIMLILLSLAGQAQVISRFTWSSTPLTTAAQGPNGISISASATSSFIGGSLGYALNPGLPTRNVDLVITGSPVFDINSIDIDLYFRREESLASFFKRGANFDFGSTNGYLTVIFTTTQGSTPGNLTINSGNIVAIADDHTFHHYRFRYDNNTGVANAWVDGTIVYTYNGVAGRPLSWTGAGNVVIGENMDATSRDVAVLSNLTVQLASSSILPVNLLSFKATEESAKTFLEWSASNETSLAYYLVERAADGINFQAIKKITANNTNRTIDNYSFYDQSPLPGNNYYRLKLVDNEGYYDYSKVKQTTYNQTSSSIKCFPNPARDYVYLNTTSEIAGSFPYSIYNVNGTLLTTASVNMQKGKNQVKIDLANKLVPATYIIRIYNMQTNSFESFTVVKKA